MSIETPVPNLTLLKATDEHLALVHDLILELARYEKLEGEVVATRELLRRHLFGDSPTAEVVLALHRGEPVGFALFFTTFSTFVGRPGIYIEDLFVRPEARGVGIGKMLVAFVANLAVEREYGRLEWNVLDWNEPAIRFYEKIGAKRVKGWLLHRMVGQELRLLADHFRSSTADE